MLCVSTRSLLFFQSVGLLWLINVSWITFFFVCVSIYVAIKVDKRKKKKGCHLCFRRLRLLSASWLLVCSYIPKREQEKQKGWGDTATGWWGSSAVLLPLPSRQAWVGISVLRGEERWQQQEGTGVGGWVRGGDGRAVPFVVVLGIATSCWRNHSLKILNYSSIIYY